jgi:hypothetical protein
MCLMIYEILCMKNSLQIDKLPFEPALFSLDSSSTSFFIFFIISRCVQRPRV